MFSVRILEITHFRIILMLFPQNSGSLTFEVEIMRSLSLKSTVEVGVG